jgi:hypothetical protein
MDLLFRLLIEHKVLPQPISNPENTAILANGLKQPPGSQFPGHRLRTALAAHGEIHSTRAPNARFISHSVAAHQWQFIFRPGGLAGC